VKITLTCPFKAHHGFVSDVAVLLEAGLTLLLLRGHVVRDVRVVALLCTHTIDYVVAHARDDVIICS